MKKLILSLLLAISFTAANAQCQPFYADYSLANYDDNLYLFRFSSHPTLSDSMLYSGAAQKFRVTPLGGYEDVSDPQNTSWSLNVATYNIDSLFALVSHENNSGLTDTIVLLACGTDALGRPDESNIIWSDTIFTNQSLSPGGNWWGQDAAAVISFTTSLTADAANPVTVSLRYLGNPLDTFAIIGGCQTNGGFECEWPSYYDNSYIKHSLYLPNWLKNATVQYSNGNYFEGQNWSIWAHGCYDGTTPDLMSDICRVTTDPTGLHWQVSWGKGTSPLISSYEVVFDYGSGPVVVHSQPYGSFSSFISPDALAQVMISVRSKDAGGNSLYTSPIHMPIYLNIVDTLNNQAKLAFIQYIGAQYSTNRIYRGTSPGNMVLYDSIPVNPNVMFNFYTDPQANTYGNYYYQVEAVFTTSCYPSTPVEGNNTGDEKSVVNSKTNALSNIVQYTVGINEEQALLNTITLYPNPTQNTLNINLGKATTGAVNVQVLNTLGQVVKTHASGKAETLQMDISSLPNGVYFVQVQAFGGIKTLRLVKN